MGAFGEPKRKQTRTNIDVKNEDEKEALQDRLGGMLGRFGSRLGTQETPETFENVLFHQKSRFCNKASRGELD